MSSRPARTVLVTGSARRLGRSIALDLAGAGWQVAVHYRGSAAEAAQTVADCARHAPSEAFQADLADEAQLRALLPRVVQRFGSVDAVVNNASRFEHDDARSFTPASLASHMASNTAAPVLLAQALAAHLQERGGTGCVVNLLDQKLWNLNPDFFSYTLSKAALEAATTLLAQALAPQLRVGRGGARAHADQPHAGAGALRAAAQAVAARPVLHTRAGRARRALRAGERRDHRDHAAGRRRPAPDEVRPRFLADVMRVTITPMPPSAEGGDQPSGEVP
jgi:NAD(P)-dependent dehydrogenase (short-subunit alcohol dehydrogenase family)